MAGAAGHGWWMRKGGDGGGGVRVVEQRPRGRERRGKKKTGRMFPSRDNFIHVVARHTPSIPKYVELENWTQ